MEKETLLEEINLAFAGRQWPCEQISDWRDRYGEREKLFELITFSFEDEDISDFPKIEQLVPMLAIDSYAYAFKHILRSSISAGNPSLYLESEIYRLAEENNYSSKILNLNKFEIEVTKKAINYLTFSGKRAVDSEICARALIKLEGTARGI